MSLYHALAAMEFVCAILVTQKSRKKLEAATTSKKNSAARSTEVLLICHNKTGEVDGSKILTRQAIAESGKGRARFL